MSSDQRYVPLEWVVKVYFDSAKRIVTGLPLREIWDLGGEGVLGEGIEEVTGGT